MVPAPYLKWELGCHEALRSWCFLVGSAQPLDQSANLTAQRTGRQASRTYFESITSWSQTQSGIVPILYRHDPWHQDPPSAEYPLIAHGDFRPSTTTETSNRGRKVEKRSRNRGKMAKLAP